MPGSWHCIDDNLCQLRDGNCRDYALCFVMENTPSQSQGGDAGVHANRSFGRREEARAVGRINWVQKDFRGNRALLRMVLKGLKIAQKTEMGGWRRDNPRKRVDLRGIDLHGLDLGFVSLENTNLANAKLRHCALFGTRFDGCNLTGADIRDCAAGIYLSFEGALLGRAQLAESAFLKSSFVRADMRGLDLRTTSLRGSDLSYADLRDAEVDLKEFLFVRSLYRARLDSTLRAAVRSASPDLLQSQSTF